MSTLCGYVITPQMKKILYSNDHQLKESKTAVRTKPNYMTTQENLYFEKATVRLLFAAQEGVYSR